MLWCMHVYVHVCVCVSVAISMYMCVSVWVPKNVDSEVRRFVWDNVVNIPGSVATLGQCERTGSCQFHN